MADNSTYQDCICLESNSSTLNYTISISNVESGPAEQDEIANPLNNESEAKKKFEEGVNYSERRDKSDNLSEKRDYNLKAIQSYRDATNFSSDHGEAWYNLGNAYYYDSKFQEALHAYRNSAKRFPNGYGKNRSWVLFNMGNSYYMLRNFTEAEKYYNNTINTNPDYLDAYNNRALARIELEKYNGSLTDLDESLRLLELMPDKKIEAVRAWNNKGLALSHLERYDEAFSALQNATKIKDNPYSYCYEGLIVAQLNQQMQESLNLLNKSLHLKDYSLSERDMYMIWTSRGNVYLKFKNYSNAVSEFTNATMQQHSRGPSWNNASAWIGNGTALMHLNNRNLEALHSFNRALEQDPNRTEAWIGKGDALYKLGCYDDAMKAYRKGMDLDGLENKSLLPIMLIVIIMVLTFISLIQLIYYLYNSTKNKQGDEKPFESSLKIFSKESINIWFFPISLALQLCIFLFIIKLYFPRDVFNYYSLASICILIATFTIWFLFSPHDAELKTKLELTLTEFSITRLGSLWMMLLLLFYIGSVLYISIYLIQNNVPFDPSRQFLIKELMLVIALGFAVFFIPILRIVTSCHVDDDVRKVAIAFNFCWMGMTSLYLSRLFWSQGWNEFAIPLDIGQGVIPNKIPILLAALFSMFLFLFLIPYIYGWRKSKQERQRLLSIQIDILKDLSIASQLEGKQQQQSLGVIKNRICTEVNILKKSDILDICINNKELWKDEFDEINIYSNESNINKLKNKFELQSNFCHKAKNVDYRFKCFDLLIEVLNNIKPTKNNDVPAEPTDPWSENLNILAKHKSDKIQKELDVLMQTKPQIWIAAVSLISPLVVQILGSWMIKLGLSTPPGNLLSTLNQILTGI